MAIPTFTQGATPSIVDLVGDTPLIRLRRIERDLPGVELYAKAEWQNPGGSVKDRPALRMIQEGIASGQLVAVKGIGRWTAEIFLMFRLGRPDILPADDLGLMNAVHRAYRVRKRPDA